MVRSMIRDQAQTFTGRRKIMKNPLKSFHGFWKHAPVSQKSSTLLAAQKKYCIWFRISQSTWVKFCGIWKELNMLEKNMWCKHHFQHHDAYQITWEVFFSPGKTGQFIAILQLRTWNLNLHRLWTSLWAGPKSYSVWIYPPPQLTIVYNCGKWRFL